VSQFHYHVHCQLLFCISLASIAAVLQLAAGMRCPWVDVLPPTTCWNAAATALLLLLLLSPLPLYLIISDSTLSSLVFEHCCCR
jgi:hypothetical protein